MKPIFLSFSLFLMACLMTPTQAQAESASAFVQRYITTVNASLTPEQYSMFWRKKTRDNLHDTTEGLKNEFTLSTKMHELFLHYGGFSNVPEIKKWNDKEMTISYTFTLKHLIPNDLMQRYFMQGPANYKHFQISVEQEKGQWVVSGEGFIGNM